MGKNLGDSIRIPLPKQKEQSFSDKSKYNRPEQKQKIKKIIRDVVEEFKEASQDISKYIYIAAMERVGYLSGGYGIMKKLVEQQSGREIKDKGFTDGFGILKKWQKQKQKGIQNPVSEPDGDDGYDIMKQVVKHPAPVKR